MRVLLALCALCFISATAPAQVAREVPAAKLSPIPPLPAAGVIPDAMSKNHLFIDTINAELVIIYLENGNTVTKRVPLASQVDPVFHLSSL